MEEERCYHHKNIPALMWRKGLVLGDPERVPLCGECIKSEQGFDLIYYPLDEYISRFN
jgi:hypothetical protein